MSELTFSTIFYALTFLVPGFLMNWALTLVIPQKGVKEEPFLIRLLTFSALNYALCFWLISPLIKGQTLSVLSWFFILFVFPVLFGLIGAFILQNDFLYHALSKLGITPVSYIPTSWDYSLVQKEGRWVIVTLQDGSEVAGIYADNSFASSDSNERDLFLEEVWRIEEDGTWSPVDGSKGIWIHGREIRHIEFREKRHEGHE